MNEKFSLFGVGSEAFGLGGGFIFKRGEVLIMLQRRVRWVGLVVLVEEGGELSILDES